MDPSIVRGKTNAGKPFFLLPLLPVIFFFLHNINQFMELVFTIEVLLLFLIYSSLALFIFVCGRLLLRLNNTQSLLISTLAIIGFLFFGVLQDFLFGFKSFLFLSNSFFLLAFLVIGLLVAVIFLKKKKIQPVRTNRYFSLLFLLLICLELLILGYKFMTGKSMHAITRKMTTPVLAGLKTSEPQQPDIYHIIFDGHSSLTALKQYWHYDDDIYPFLSSRGFYTLDSASSNYRTTPFSVSSIFNMQYINGANPYLARTSVNFYIGQLVYRNNVLFKFLKQQHYEFSIFSPLDSTGLLTTFGFLGVSKPVSWLRTLTLERIFLNPWLTNKIKGLFGSRDRQPGLIVKSMHDFADYNKKALAHIMSDCQNASNQKPTSPVFYYTHFMLPHEPYVLDENGNFVSTAEPNANNMNGYLEQVKYCNKLIKQITDCLLSDTTRKKIIIFQGDHGYRDFTEGPLSASYQALSAIYFYNKNYSGLRKDLSHVNTYRVILNNFFDARLPLLKDSLVIKKRD